MIRTASRGYSPLLAHPFAEGGVNMDEIFKRGTCRHFKELTPVAKEDLLTLVKAGMQARACGNQEAREFIIVTRDDLVKAISHNSLVAGPARKASAAIVIVGKKENISFPEEWSFDCAAAAENILIEAEHLGLGSIWLQVYPYADRKAHLSNILDIPAEMEPFCIIAIGYAERKPVRMNRYNERIIYNDLYGSRKNENDSKRPPVPFRFRRFCCKNPGRKSCLLFCSYLFISPSFRKQESADHRRRQNSVLHFAGHKEIRYPIHEDKYRRQR